MKRRFFILIILLASVIVSFFIFQNRITALVYANSISFLEETASLYAETFKIKLNDQLFILENKARSFENVDMDDQEAVRKTIMSLRRMGDFKRIYVADRSGEVMNIAGEDIGNISETDYFKSAMQGEAGADSYISMDEEGERILVLAVPIFQNSRVVGVVTGTFAYSVLENIFSVSTFSGNGYAYLINDRGRILGASQSENRLWYSDNWVDFFVENKVLDIPAIDKIRDDIRAGKTASMRYQLGNQERIMVYAPVGLNNWSVVSIMTADFINAQQRKIIWSTVILILVLLALFVFTGYLFYKIINQSEKVAKENMRYVTTTKSLKTLVYEYDFASRVIEFSGDTSFLFGGKMRQLSLENFNIVEKLIHESDRNLLSHLRDFVASGETSYRSELRLLIGGEYVWYQFSGTLIKDKESGAPVKMIGNLVNVNAQVVREQEFKEMAETDLLSGLLNKVSLEKRITEWTAAADGSVGAFYILDLDNFKQVNDKIGHSAGDRAICDAANKLNLVFSERDFIARIGGDEFCVFLTLPSTLPENKIQEIIAEKARVLNSILHETYCSGDVTVSVMASIGISLFPAQAKTYKDLFERADAALYHVKKQGKNSFAMYDESMKENGESIYG
ncbi:MAG: diguanylate cyclase [Treponema sp.]|nr:diguanylate cyclase [Treponema sp.]